MGMERVVVHINDYEHFTVVFEGDQPLYVTHTSSVWSESRPAVSKIMSHRVQKAIDAARAFRRENGISEIS